MPKPSPNALALIEACYDVTADYPSWCRQLVRHFAPFLSSSDAILCSVATRNPDGTDMSTSFGTPLGEELETAGHGPSFLSAVLNQKRLSDLLFERAASTVAPVATLMTELPPPLIATIRGILPARFANSLSLAGPLGDAKWLVVNCALDKTPNLTASHRTTLQKLVNHVRAGYLLRQQLGTGTADSTVAASAIYTPNGQLQHTSAPLSPKTTGQLATAVAQMDQARCIKRKSTQDPSQLWSAVVAGRYSLLEVFDKDGKRHVLAVETGLDAPVSNLTPREEEVAHLVAQGCSNKLIASKLGIAIGTVGVHVSATLRKLGLRNRADLIHYFSTTGTGQG